jgi:parallel beta-helix repeat protein
VRNIRIAPPADRIPLKPATPPRAEPGRITTTLATLPIVFLLPALAIAWFPVSASDGPSITASPSPAAIGERVVVVGRAFTRRGSVQLTWDGSSIGMPSHIVNGSGGFRATFRVPPAEAGSLHVVAATATAARNAVAGGETASTTISIVSLAATSSPPPDPSPGGSPTSSPTTTSAPGPSTVPDPTTSPGPTSSAVATSPPGTTATPAPTAASNPTPAPPQSTPVPTSAPAPTGSASGCGTSLQGLINAAPTGSLVQLPNCVFREAVTISKALTLRGPATIKGSDVWTDWNGNVSATTVPSLPTNGNCSAARCAWPEQVFVDSAPQRQVGSSDTPGAGEFKLDSGRHVVLGSSPAGKTVEVTVRRTWITVTADDVTIIGLTMRHAASGPQNGALQESAGADRLIVRDSVLSDTHGAVVNLQGTVGSKLLNSDVSRGGQLGVHVGGSFTRDVTIAGNRIHDNNTEGFQTGWEAGGLKAAVSTNLVMSGNDVYGNDGPGLWCDIDCHNVTFSGNRVHDNTKAGIFFEISDGAVVTGNVVWENGWGSRAWGWGAGILISSSANAEVRDNVVAWNADGISVLTQNRSDAPGPIVGNNVHDNTVVIAPTASDTSDKFLLGFLQDWSGVLFNPASNNRGASNRYWHAKAEPTGRFGWNGTMSRLDDFNATPGEEGGRYLTDSQRDSALSAAGVPLTQRPH